MSEPSFEDCVSEVTDCAAGSTGALPAAIVYLAQQLRTGLDGIAASITHSPDVDCLSSQIEGLKLALEECASSISGIATAIENRPK